MAEKNIDNKEHKDQEQHWQSLFSQLDSGLECYFEGTVTADKADEISAINRESGEDERKKRSSAGYPSSDRSTRGDPSESSEDVAANAEQQTDRQDASPPAETTSDDLEPESAEVASAAGDNWALLADTLGVPGNLDDPAPRRAPAPTGEDDTEPQPEPATPQVPEVPELMMAETQVSVEFIDSSAEKDAPEVSSIDESVEFLNSIFRPQPTSQANDDSANAEESKSEPVAEPDRDDEEPLPDFDSELEANEDYIEYEIHNLYTESAELETSDSDETPRRTVSGTSRKPRSKPDRRDKPNRSSEPEKRDDSDASFDSTRSNRDSKSSWQAERSDRKRRRSPKKEKQRESSESREQSARDDSGEQSRERRQRDDSKDKKKFPTWREAVKLITDTNLSQRKKSGGRGRRRQRRPSK